VDECKPLHSGQHSRDEHIHDSGASDSHFTLDTADAAGSGGVLQRGSEVTGTAAGSLEAAHVLKVAGRGLHSSTSQLNLSRFWSLCHLNYPAFPSKASYVEPKSGRV